MKPARRAYTSLLRLGFRLLYNELAWTYDAVSWSVSLGQWRSWQRASLEHLVGPRVLEVAFGTGNLQLDLHAAGCCADVYGIDLSAHMVRITRRKLAATRSTCESAGRRLRRCPSPPAPSILCSPRSPHRSFARPRCWPSWRACCGQAGG